MSLSTSRQQFLACESHGEPDIHYKRRGGIFISTCICVTFIIVAVLIAILVGIIVYYISYFKVSHETEDFWNEADPFGQTSKPTPDLRLSSHIVPSFYRLKIKADLENSTFGGDVYITIRANKQTKEIILHSQNLRINPNITLTELIYENVETLHPSTKTKREINTIETDTTTESVDVTIVDNETISTVPSHIEMTTSNIPLTETIPTLSIDKQVTHSNLRNIRITKMEFSTGDRLILRLATPLTPNVDYSLQLSFHGEILNSLTGFYKSTYREGNEDRQFGVTQFEPTSARAAFPCFDEPAFKAKFEISIAHRSNISVLSNMKVAAQEPIESEPGWQWTHFDRSVKMSTYLVAFMLSDFQYLETSYLSKDNVTKPIRVWARPSLVKNAKYALTIVPKLLTFYEDVFGLPYDLDKIDLVAVPDFSNGAMENWGLITFRETTLLFDEKQGVPREKQNVAIDVAHELAHQWFGNLVTMRWWSDLWLNEGFATYMEYVGVNHITPEWNILESCSRDKMNLLKVDALKTTSPVSRQVADAAEISQKFDEISYAKGANLIRMLNHTISYELFHKALVLYLNKWKYQNAEENDLWNAMSEATRSDPALKDLSVQEFMNTWTRQPGYPVVNVYRDYSTGQVSFQQALFTSSEISSKNKDQLWHIPLSYTTMDTVANWSTKPKLWLNDKSLSAKLPIDDTQALYVNVDAIGYYRVNYDQKNWELLSAALKSKTVNSPITKAQLIDDAFNLAKAGYLNYSYALGLTTSVIDGEDNKIVWDMLLDNIYFLKENLKATAGYIYFQDYIKLMLHKQLERVNYGLVQPKDDNEVFLTEHLVSWECMVESPRCMKWARDEFEKWVAQPDLNDNPIPNYLRSLVYNMAIKYGGRREFDLLWNYYLNTTDPGIKNSIISCMPTTREESLISLLLERSLSEIPNQSAITVWAVEAPIGTKVAQDFLIENFDRVYEKFSKMDDFMFPIAVNSAFGAISSNDELDKLKRFALQHKDKLMPMSQLLQKMVDSAVLRINWVKKYAAGINQWFKEYLTSTNTTNTHTNTTPPPLPSPTLTQNITINIATNTSTTSSL